MREYPQAALSWYAVGCYYMATRQYDQARHYFGKASLLDKKSPDVWLAYGHAFAALVGGSVGAREGGTVPGGVN